MAFNASFIFVLSEPSPATRMCTSDLENAAVLFVFVSLLVLPRNCASCQVHVAEKLLRPRAPRPIGEN